MKPSSENSRMHFEVFQRDGVNMLVSREYGIVVRGTDMNAAIRELQARIASAEADFSDLGLPLPGEVTISPRQQVGEDSARRSLRNVAIVASVAAILTIGAAYPVVSFLSGLRQSVSAILPQASGVDGAGRSVIDLVNRIADAVSQITPEREQELQTSISKIATKLAPLVQAAAQPLSRTAPRECP